MMKGKAICVDNFNIFYEGVHTVSYFYEANMDRFLSVDNVYVYRVKSHTKFILYKFTPNICV